MLRIEVSTEINDQEPLKKALKKYGIHSQDVLSSKIVHRSLDARANRPVSYLWQLDVQLNNEAFYMKRMKNKARIVEPYVYECPPCGTKLLNQRPVIVGFGPAGMAAAYLLAKKGYQPLVLERGPAIEDRKKLVDTYWKTGVLNSEGNVQFGEGGAGAFSDGKLTTRIKDKRVGTLLDALIEAGADPSIAWMNHPHIGTDSLCEIDVNLRKAIEAMGGEIRFNTRLEDIEIQQGKVVSVTANGEVIPTENVILAIGHSARDTFQMLYEKQIPLESKPFAVGVRVEHLQSFINKRQYRKISDPTGLPAAEYHLSHTSASGKGVYSFCMCPGGYVVAGASEENTIVVNGMSYAARDGRNANSALVVQVDQTDFGSTDILAGMHYQQSLEHLAYDLGKGKAPAQLIEDYLQNKTSTATAGIEPTYQPGVTLTNLNSLFNETIHDSLKEMLVHTNNVMPGFTTNGAIMTGVETRTSSPIRILRDMNHLESMVSGLFPCGEGAGYAGGIVSSAIDGVRCAEELISRYAPMKGNSEC